jgi:hypothetical protein
MITQFNVGDIVKCKKWQDQVFLISSIQVTYTLREKPRVASYLDEAKTPFIQEKL